MKATARPGAGVGKAVESAVAGKDINLIILSWLVAAVIRVAQGSATVAMLTTSGERDVA